MSRAWWAAALVAVACSKKEPAVDPEAAKRDAFLAKAEAEVVARLEVKLKALEGAKLPKPTTVDHVEIDQQWFAVWWVNEQNLAAVAGDPKGVLTEGVYRTHACIKQIRHPDFGKREYSKLRSCEDGHHGFVIRTFEKIDPYVTDYGGQAQPGTFKPGVAHGDVVGFELATGKHVGGYRWHAKSDTYSDKLSLQSDFERAIVEAVEHGAIEFVKHP